MVAVAGVVYRGSLRETEVPVVINLVGPGIGQIDCIECGGTGDWTPFHPDSPPEGVQCVECKGTGRIYISA